MYGIYVVPQAWDEIKDLPGHIKTQVRQQVSSLASIPRPSSSKRLNLPDAPYELRRVRIDRWRVVYAITEENATIDILAVRKRPPYDYGDLAEVLAQL
jgi:mRNA interferase RelE/StbE